MGLNLSRPCGVTDAEDGDGEGPIAKQHVGKRPAPAAANGAAKRRRRDAESEEGDSDPAERQRESDGVRLRQATHQ